MDAEHCKPIKSSQRVLIECAFVRISANNEQCEIASDQYETSMYMRVAGRYKLAQFGGNTFETLPRSATGNEIQRSGMRKHFDLPPSQLSRPFEPVRVSAPGAGLTGIYLILLRIGTSLPFQSRTMPIFISFYSR